MNKWIFLLGMLLPLSVIGQSWQTQSYDWQWQVGVQGMLEQTDGYNLGSESDPLGQEARWISGIGIRARVWFHPNIGLTAGVNGTQRGRFFADQQILDSLGIRIIDTTDVSMHTRHVQIPLGMMFRSGKWYIGLGPSIEFLTQDTTFLPEGISPTDIVDNPTELATAARLGFWVNTGLDLPLTRSLHLWVGAQLHGPFPEQFVIRQLPPPQIVGYVGQLNVGFHLGLVWQLGGE